MPDAGCIPAYRIRLGGVESHKKREKCNTSFFQAIESEFVPPERGFLLENRLVLSAAFELEYLHHDIGSMNVISHSPDSWVYPFERLKIKNNSVILKLLQI